MTEPTPTIERDVESPLRLQPVVARSDGSRGLSVNLIAVGLVGFVVVGLILGTAFDNNSGPPTSPSAVAVASGKATATLRPSRQPTPTRRPLATPLPKIEIRGQDLPTEQRLVFGNGQEILDLATGTLRSFGRSYEDIVWPVGDSFVCICVVRELGVNTSAAVRLQFGRFDQMGKRLVERDLVELDDIVAIPEMSEGFNVVAAIDGSGATLFVLGVVRRPPVWDVELHVVDVATGDLLDSKVIGSIPVDLEEPRPSGSPRTDGGAPDGVYAWANSITAAPDGQSVLVMVGISEVRADVWTGRSEEWIIPIRGGAAGTPEPLRTGTALSQDRGCVGRPSFVDAELVVQVCSPLPATVGQSWAVRRVTTSGEVLAEWPIGGSGVEWSVIASLVDRSTRSVYVWDAIRHRLSKVDIDTGRAQEGVVDESLLDGERSPPGRNWFGVDPGLVLSTDGTRLFALGLTEGTGNAATSTGVWVIDADTLEVVDHWQPRATLTSLAVSADGRFIYAIGAAGFDADGYENPRWPASVTVYDAATGEVVVLYGAVGDGQSFGFQTVF